jgi:hypothetical protein
MSKESEASTAVLRADLVEISAKIKRRVAYITQKAKQYDSSRAERLRDNVIDAATESERLCYAICDAFDRVDRANAVASIYKRQSDVKSIRDALARVLILRRQFYQGQTHYYQAERHFTDYAISQGALLIFEGID